MRLLLCYDLTRCAETKVDLRDLDLKEGAEALLQFRVPIKTSEQNWSTSLVKICNLEHRPVMQHACLADNRQATEQ